MRIIEKPVRNHSVRPAGIDIRCIVLHHTGGGTLAGAISWWDQPESQVSAHYLIDYTGTIYRCVAESRKAWHAGVSEFLGVEKVNDFSIGIEILGDGSVFTRPQMTALVELTADIMHRHPLIIIKSIVGHEFVATPPGRKSDPGSHFPWEDFRSRVSSNAEKAAEVAV